MAEDFGAYLKHERELRGVSLEEIAAATKIHIRYLQALEQNDFDALPGDVFIKGFIRSYAKSIGSSGEEMIAAYDDAFGRERQEIQQKVEAQQVAAEIKKNKLRKSLVLGIGLVVIIAGIVLFARSPRTPQPVAPAPETASETGDRSIPATMPESIPEAVGEEASPPSGPQNETPSTSASTAAEPAPAAASRAQTTASEAKANTPQQTTPHVESPREVSPSSQEEVPTQEAAKPPENNLQNKVSDSEKSAIMENQQKQSVVGLSSEQSEMASNSKPLTLVIRVSENSWFNLTVDDGREEDFILPAGSSKTIRADNNIRITIGNRRGTQLILNDQELMLPESSDNVIRNLKVNLDSLG